MSTRTKASVAMAGLLLAILAGAYLSGWLTYLFLQVNGPLTALTYWNYHQALELPAYQPYATRIHLAGGLGFGVFALVWLGALHILFRPKKRATHGDARFALDGDIARSKLVNDNPYGVIVGKHRSRLLRLVGPFHILLAAVTRAGKGVSFVMPNLLHYAGSLVVVDMKQEGHEVSSKCRSQWGPVYLFNPFADDLRTHRWNPFAYVRTEALHRTSDIQAIAQCLYKVAPGQDPFWTNTARASFVAAASLLFDVWQHAQRAGANQEAPYPTLGGVYRLLSGDGNDLRGYLKSRLARPDVCDETRTKFGNITSLPEQTFASVIGCAQAPLLIFASLILDKATSGNDFDLRTLRRQRQTIHVGVTPNKLGEASGILNLFFEQAIKLNTDATPQKDSTVKYECLFLLDEFTALGPIDAIVNDLTHLAGYNIRLACVIQSLSQLDDVYGPDKARTITSNLTCRVIYTPGEQRDANEYSEMLGNTTERKRQRTRTSGGQVSYTDIEECRPLMLPQELKELDIKKEIIFIRGLAHPIMCDKIRYYEDKDCKPRLLGAVEAPKLRFGGGSPAGQTS
ncbi:MAG TPA: type IV secretory system conjugative DNA transfer family protein [Dyella sp.]|uniref:type IV secretory system conjugative DNA transfer family protein n=1 Tax=Dyella sp. TaxID=1869338 RepID=UPI002C964044|nr:type IV secretory system conjugative DNA transfer family protein [Dyella sp.]HUB92045.1 type IV secretory system conjugative DNA transfer family protein [Dyella sp.]